MQFHFTAQYRHLFGIFMTSLFDQSHGISNQNNLAASQTSRAFCASWATALEMNEDVNGQLSPGIPDLHAVARL